MNQIHKIPITLLILIILLCTNCTKDETTSQNPSKKPVPAPTEKPNPNPDPENDKILYPIQLQTGKSIILLTYSPTKTLTKIDYGDDNTITLKYTSTGVLQGLSRYKKTSETFAIDYETDVSETITGAKTYNVINKKSKPEGYYILKYMNTSKTAPTRSTSQPHTIGYYNNSNEIIYEQIRTFNQSGNLLNSVNPATGDTNNNTYDTKNGLYKHVLYASLLAFEQENNLLLSTNNNIKNIDYPAKPALSKTFDYTYNADNYPSTITTMVNGVKSITKITYSELK